MNRKIILSALAPFLLLGGLLYLFIQKGPAGVFENSVAPIESLFIGRVILSPEHIRLNIMNDGPEPVTVAQVLVNDAYWQFEMQPDFTLEPLAEGVVDIDYPWVAGDAAKVTLLSGNGTTFDKEIEVAMITPVFDGTYITAFVLLGIYVGVLPVLLGLLWLPFLRELRGKWYDLLLAFTVGLLVFLGVDALSEAIELTGELPDVLNGIGILLIGFVLAVFSLASISYKTEHLRAEKGERTQALVWGYLIALGIGIHNLGEGLAIGSAYALGEIALGGTLVIGFMLHNVTEGIAIIAPLTRVFKGVKSDLGHMMLMGVAAGIPTVIGALIGGLSYSPELALFFLAIGAGAIFEVVFDILKAMKGEKRWLTLFEPVNVFGFLAGLLVIYITGLLII